MKQTKALMIVNNMHRCPACDDILILEDDGHPQTWECPYGHTHIQNDCCETVYLDTVEDEGILSERAARRAREQEGWV